MVHLHLGLRISGALSTVKLLCTAVYSTLLCALHSNVILYTAVILLYTGVCTLHCLLYCILNTVGFHTCSLRVYAFCRERRF